MIKQNKMESPSSEDDIYLLTFKEAANQGFLENSSLYDKDNNKRYCKDINGLNRLIFNYKLFECQKEFVAKKLYERLEMEIILENKRYKEKMDHNQNQKTLGIKLCTASKVLLKKVNKRSSKKLNLINNEKITFFKSKNVVIKSEKILSQHDTKYWVNRKPSKQFKYKKSKNGTLLEVL